MMRIADETDADLLAGIIKKAHTDVACRFNLTPENCPKHPSNCTPAWVMGDLVRGVRYLLAEQDSEAVGCVAVEKADPTICYLERLSVLPGNRRNGIGQRLVEQVFQVAADLEVPRIGIGIIADYLELKAWYLKLGFTEGETKTFAHLPFRVLLMTYTLP